MIKFQKVIVVSQDDTCRGPIAKTVLKSRFSQEPQVDSRGMVVLFPEPVNQKAEAILISNGLTAADHQSVQIGEADFDGGPLVLTMTQKQKNDLLVQFPQAKHIYTIHEYVGKDGEVGNPIGGALADYGECFKNLKRLSYQIEDKWKEED